MKQLIFTLLFVNLCISITAQNIKINGKVSDEKSDAVIAATVLLISEDSTLISSTITNSDGNFELITSRRADLCFLHITHVEFESSYNSLVPDKDTAIVVQLKENLIVLSEITVVAKKPIYKFEHEKLIVNVSDIPNVQTYDILRLIQVLPGVVKSGDGLTLNGETATIYIDGRKQTINVSNIGSILSLMPVAAIDKVELISSSNGVYDASDGAVINVVYKKQKVNGYYLSAGGYSATYDKGHSDGGGSTTIIFKKKNIMFNSMVSYRNNYSTTQVNDTLQYWNNSLLYQNRNSEGRTNAYMGMLNLNWAIKNGHNLNFNFNFYDGFSNNTSNQLYIFQNDHTTQDFWNVKSKGNDDMWAGQVEYTSPDTLNDKFKISYGVVCGGQKSRRNTFDENTEILYTNDGMTAHRHTVKLDYEHRFTEKMNLFLGIKMDLGQLNDDVIYIETNNSNRYPTSRFWGKEYIYAGYAQLKYIFNPIWTASASLRSEHTYYNLDFLTLNENITDSYTNLFPFFTVSHNSNNRRYQTSFSFGSSISRPNYNYMLPGTRYSNQYSSTKGNPEVKPRINYDLKWTGLFYQFINAYWGYQIINNLQNFVFNISSTDPLVKESKYQNIADASRIYGGININYLVFSDKLSGQIGGSVQNVNYKNPKNGFELPQGKSDYWQGSLNKRFNYQISRQLGVNCEYYFFPKYNNFTYTYHPRWLMNAGIHYNSPKNNWALSLDANDIFHSNKQFREMYFGNNYNRDHSYRSSQYIQLSFILKFKGGEKVEDKARNGSLDTDRFSKN
ncbi:MAG: outer membrane beta-barrel protein [Dysgonamonadaceae bacterium]|jgi:hypothetical protein|nr:outer membrane beta-barrel protein [Dysgonamonadaceae bacterium]